MRLPVCLLIVAAGVPVLAQPPAPGSRPPAPRGGSVIGSVRKVDAAKRLVTVAGIRKDAPERTVSVPADVPIIRMVAAKASDLKLGDSISVEGLPLVLSAAQVRIGDEPARRPTPPPPPRPGQKPAPAPAVTSTGDRVYARVIRLNPLVAQLGFGPTFEIRTNSKTRFTRALRLAIGQLKPGDPFVAFGAVQPDGTVKANRVRIGFEAMPFMRR